MLNLAVTTTPVESPVTQLQWLSPEVRAQIYEQTAQLKPEESVQWLETEFGISKVSVLDLAQWRQWQSLQARLDIFNDISNQVVAWFANNNPTASRELIREAGITLFLSEAMGRQDEKAFALYAKLSLDVQKDLAKLRQDERKLDLDERRLQLAEKKAQQEEDEKKANEPVPLTPEQKAARFREIFGIK